MNRYAVIVDGAVFTIASWDGVTSWTPPGGGVAVELVEGEECGLWYLYNPEATPRFSSPE